MHAQLSNQLNPTTWPTEYSQKNLVPISDEGFAELKDRVKEAMIAKLPEINESLRKVGEARQMQAEARQKQTQARQNQAEARQNQAEARQKQVEARQMQAEGRQMQAEGRQIQAEARQKQVEARQMQAEGRQMVQEADQKLLELHAKKQSLVAQQFYSIFSKNSISVEESHLVFQTYLTDGSLSFEKSLEGKSYPKINSMKAVTQYLGEHSDIKICDFRVFKANVNEIPTLAEFLKRSTVKAIAFNSGISEEAKKSLADAATARNGGLKVQYFA